MGETISARDIGGVISEIEREFPGVRVTSADRTAQQNAAAGGARDSQHLHGRARDLDISAVPEDRRGALVERLKSLGVTGMGMYGPTSTSLHIDMRPGAFTAFGPDRTRNSISQTPSYFQQVANTTNPQGPRATPPPALTVPNVDNLPLSPAARSVLGMQMTNVGNQARNATEIAGVQQGQQQRLAEGERDASRSYATEQRRLTQDLERRQQPIPEFIATRETARDIGSLASLLMVAGSMLGGKGKQGALMAVQSMTGMMAGYRQGRQDLYQRERQNYETGLRQVQAQNQQLQQAFERSQRTAQTDLEAARAEFRVAATALGANLPALMGEQMGYAGIGQALNTTATLVGQLDQADRTARQTAAVRAQTLRDQQERDERLRANRIADEQAQAERNRGARQAETIENERRRNLQQAGMRAQYIIENQPEDRRARTVEVLSRAANNSQVSKGINDAYTIFESSEAAARQVAQYRDAVGPLGAALNRFRADPATGAFGSVVNWALGRVPEGTTDQAILSAAVARDEATMNRAIDRDVERGLMSPDMAARAKIVSKTLFSLALADAQATGRPTVFLERALSDFYSQALRPETLLEIIHGRAEEATRRLPDPSLRPNTLTNYNDNFSILASMRDNRFDPQAFLDRHSQVGRGGDAPRRPPNAVTPGGARAPGRPSATPSGPATQRWDPVSGRLVPVE
jgi:hypothetical protein